MRVISRNTLAEYWIKRPETKASLQHWLTLAKSAHWRSMDDVQRTFPKAKVINADRARFEIHGGDYRMVVAFFFPAEVAYIKFVGTHKEYDRTDAKTVSQF